MAEQSPRHIRELVRRVRARWRGLVALQATVRTALTLTGVLGAALFLTSWFGPGPAALAGLAVVALVLAMGSAIWGLWPARKVPSDRSVARFIEEHDPSLDDRLVSAVDVLDGDRAQTPALAAPMIADAERRASEVDPTDIVTTRSLGRASLWAAAALLLAGVLAFLGRETARQSVDAVSFVLFPSRVTLEVLPGDVRVRTGSPLAIEARLVGNRAPVVAQLLRADVGSTASAAAELGADEWQATEMALDASGTFRLAIDSVVTPFSYRVVAGGVSSPVYGVAVARAPRVTRIDIEYRDADGLGLGPRVDEDSGDIYAPAGSDVRLVVHTDVEAATGQMKLTNGRSVDLTPEGRVLSGSFKVVEDTSYRVALADAEGLANPGDVEYFIRMLDDRPPDVRLLKPARDREVTQLEEVDVEAQAHDDFGIDRLELVYATGGGRETVVPLKIERRARSVTSVHTLYVEDLNVRPGDFISYYVRARDIARGKPGSESRSDIFFLQVRPFDQEFALAESQATPGGGNTRALDDLVSAQKEVIVATWKLDRRGQAANGATSRQDVQAVSRAEAELKARAEETSSSFRTSVMRDPRRPAEPGGPGGSDVLRAGQTLPEEDAMTAAAQAMGRAVASLDKLKTADALPDEMEALDHLLKAQGDVGRRQVGQQAGGGTGSNRTTQDLSGLFDRQLQREQQTNYETPATTEPQNNDAESMIDKIKELARRQDELVRGQQELAREREQMTAEELKSELEKLTDQQSELRQSAEDTAKQMAGRQDQPGQKPESSQSQGQAGGADGSRQMRAASDEMRKAANELGRQDPAQAAARGNRALEQLREVEQQLRATAPDERRRTLGEMQLEARQLADAERRVGSELDKVDQGETGRDAMRRLAGEQERLADRAEQLQERLREQASDKPADDPKGRDDATDLQRAAEQAARDIERQRLVDRMQEAADQMRVASGQTERGGREPEPQPTGGRGRAEQEDVARALERVADQLAAATTPQDDQSRKLTEQLAQAQELRERIEAQTRELERLDRQAGPGRGSAESPERSSAEAAGRAGQPQEGSDGPGALARLRQDIVRQLQETRELLAQLQRDDPEFAQNGRGFTFEDRGMTLSAPGTEAFKQDFARWEELQQQVTQALDRAESSLSRRLNARASRDRLASGLDDKPPAEYQEQVDSYFKALATKKQP